MNDDNIENELFDSDEYDFDVLDPEEVESNVVLRVDDEDVLKFDPPDTIEEVLEHIDDCDDCTVVDPDEGFSDICVAHQVEVHWANESQKMMVWGGMASAMGQLNEGLRERYPWLEESR